MEKPILGTLNIVPGISCSSGAKIASVRMPCAESRFLRAQPLAEGSAIGAIVWLTIAQLLVSGRHNDPAKVRRSVDVL